MKTVVALIAACCALSAFSGCAKITGERIEFGHTYPCHNLRNKVYYITYKDDAGRINSLMMKVQDGCSRSWITCDKDCLIPNHRCCEGHAEIMRALNGYKEGFLGWF